MSRLNRFAALIFALFASASVSHAAPPLGGDPWTVQYNPVGRVAQGVLAPNGGTYPSDSYTLQISGPPTASAANPIAITLATSVLNQPAGIDASGFISVSPRNVTFTTANQVIGVTVTVTVPSSVGGASTAGGYGWKIKPASWPATTNLTVTDNGATVNGLANDAPVPPAPPVITNLLPANGSFFIYNGTTPVTFPISFNATATGSNPNSLITGLAASFDGVPFSGGVNLPLLGVVGISTLTASGSVTSPGITNSGPHTITVSATNGAGTTTATTQINILVPAKITNTNNPTFTYGQAGTFTVTATGFPTPTFSATGLPTGLAINATTGVISGTPTAAGTYTFSVTAANVFNGTAVGSDTKSFTLTVNKAALTVTANAASKTYGANDPATLTYVLTGSLIGTDKLTGALTRVAGENVGTYAINQGTLAAPANYQVTYVSALFTINLAPQTITFGSLAPVTVGVAPFALTATGGGSGNTVTYTSSNTAVATVSGSTVTVLSAGSTVITANQAGNTNYTAAAPVQQTLTVSGKLNQTITFGALASKAVGAAPFALTATASSGLTVTYTSSNPAVATVSGNTVTVIAAGTTTITASQPGNATYNAATPVAQVLTVTAAPACPTSIMWLPPVSYNQTMSDNCYIPIKFFLQQCCGTTTSGNNNSCDDDDDDDDDDDHRGCDDDGWHDSYHSGHSYDYSGSTVACKHGTNGRSTNYSSCRHDCDHDSDENSGCANLRDKTVIISIYEVGSSAPAVQYKYGTGTAYPPDYIIDGDYKYTLYFPAARGTHKYHVDVYRFPAGSTTAKLVGSKEFSVR